MKRTTRTLFFRTSWLVLMLGLSGCNFFEHNLHDGGKELTDINEGKPIDADSAALLTNRYQDKYENNFHANYCNKKILVRLLEQEGCVGVRVYRARNPKNGRFSIVLVGVNEKGNDMISKGDVSTEDNPRAIVSYDKCPENCDQSGSILYKPE